MPSHLLKRRPAVTSSAGLTRLLVVEGKTCRGAQAQTFNGGMNNLRHLDKLVAIPRNRIRRAESGYQKG